MGGETAARGWPFVGREVEVARIERIQGGAVLVGEAGVGKSRLLAATVARAGSDPDRTVRVAATESLASVPFGAFAGVLTCDLDPGAPFAAISRALRALAGDRDLDDVVLAVDDAHLLDDASAGLVLLAAQSGARVLATVRSGEPVPEAVTRLWKDEYTQRIEVRALDEARVGDLLGAVLGAPIDPRSRHRLFAATQGNLLFLRELVEHARDQGALVERGGVWSWTAAESVAPGIVDLIEDRLRRLAPEVRAVAEVVAVGEPLPRLVVDTVCSPAACNTALTQGVITPAASGRRDEVRLAHPLYTRAVRAGLGPARRAELAGRIADTILALGTRRRDDQLRIAVLQLEAGAPCDPVALATAAREAGSRGDLVLAQRLARAAYEATGTLESELLLGDILYWAGEHDEVVTRFGHDLPADATPEQVARAALLASSSLYWGFGRFDDADVMLERAIERVGPDDALSLIGQRSQILMFAGRALHAIEIGSPVLEVPSASVDARLRAYAGVLISRAVCGQLAAVEAELPTAMQLVLTAGPDLSIYTSGGVMIANFVVHLFGGDLDEIDGLIGALHSDSVLRPGDPFVGAWSLLLGRSALAQGRLTEAAIRLRESASLLDHRDFRGMLPWTLATLAQALGAAGDGPAATAAVEELAAVLPPGMHHIDIDIELGRAWAAAARGERSAPREIAEKIGRALSDDGRIALGALALHDAMRLGTDPNVVLDGLDDAAARCEGPVVTAFALHAHARAAQDLEGLLEAANAFQASGWMLHAAECAAGAMSVAADDGLRARERDAARLAATFLVPCGPASTPMLDHLGGRRALGTLTVREQEIALLAASGMSKREIADILFLSVRTIGNHINHVYAKLGISSREELRLALELSV